MLIQPCMSGMSFLCRLRTSVQSFPMYVAFPRSECRVGGGALARWPPSAAQTARAVFPQAAFTKTRFSEMQSKESIQPDLPARTRRTTWPPAEPSSQRTASA